ncbi:unnamed protein product [Adineta steineri]|uniref:Uncharacterized protein n=2 Tax=Adineta steineri TaxID=433720 RepID=A0A815Y5B1_9BILA|nr:unnamed protein product [Adineta steineri]
MLLLVKNVPPIITYIMYGLFGLQMLTFLVAFIIDAIIVRLINVHEFIFILRNIFHFISTPFVLVAYSIISISIVSPDVGPLTTGTGIIEIRRRC